MTTKTHANQKIVTIRNAAIGQEINVTYGRALTLSRKSWIVTDGGNDAWRVSANAPGGWDALVAAAKK